jgi:hypothetical protein
MTIKPALKPRRNNIIADHLNIQELLLPGRCVGKSTALALRTIAHALQNPGMDFQIVDHVPQTRAEEHTMRLVEKYLQKLNFVGFTIKKTPNGKFFLRFDLYPTKAA